MKPQVSAGKTPRKAEESPRDVSHALPGKDFEMPKGTPPAGQRSHYADRQTSSHDCAYGIPGKVIRGRGVE